MGASTSGLINSVDLLWLLAKTQANGTPSRIAIIVANNEVQSESLIAVKSVSEEKKWLHGAFARSEINGATITKVASNARNFVVALIFI
jgi:hypothetical protein